MMSAVATIWIPPSAMKTPTWMAMGRAVVRSDARSHAANASRLMPAEQRALMLREICGTQAAPAGPAPTKPGTCGGQHRWFSD
jgi:hypothetical protein